MSILVLLLVAVRLRKSMVQQAVVGASRRCTTVGDFVAKLPLLPEAEGKAFSSAAVVARQSSLPVCLSHAMVSALQKQCGVGGDLFAVGVIVKAKWGAQMRFFLPRACGP
jgi:hypothetical protein